jgi:hypothetical protein
VHVQIRRQSSYQLLDEVRVRLNVVLGHFIAITLPRHAVIIRNPASDEVTYRFPILGRVGRRLSLIVGLTFAVSVQAGLVVRLIEYGRTALLSFSL